MNIDKKDWEKVLNKVDFKHRGKQITDINRYLYWSTKSENYIEKMNENADNKNVYKENFHNGMICELEKNKYFRISKKELIMLIALLKVHNQQMPDKPLYCDEKGYRVERNDRRTTRVDAPESV